MIDNNAKIQLTEEGLKEKERRLHELIEVIRPSVLKDLQDARLQGDLSENAEYDAAKEKQAEIEAEILDLETILSNVEVIKKSTSKGISLGSKVEYIILKKKEKKTVILVSSLESDPTKDIPLISVDSPLGKALISANIGDELTVDTKNKYTIKINKVN